MLFRTKHVDRETASRCAKRKPEHYGDKIIECQLHKGTQSQFTTVTTSVKRAKHAKVALTDVTKIEHANRNILQLRAVFCDNSKVAALATTISLVLTIID